MPINLGGLCESEEWWGRTFPTRENMLFTVFALLESEHISQGINMENSADGFSLCSPGHYIVIGTLCHTDRVWTVSFHSDSIPAGVFRAAGFSLEE